MPISVSEALDSDTCSRVVLEDHTGGSYVNGLFVQGPATIRKGLGSVQQPTAQQLTLLEGSEKKTDVRAIYCNKKLYLAKEDRSSTLVHHNGDTYKLLKMSDWGVNGWFLGLGSKL